MSDTSHLGLTCMLSNPLGMTHTFRIIENVYIVQISRYDSYLQTRGNSDVFNQLEAWMERLILRYIFLHVSVLTKYLPIRYLL